ncbi:AhpC/TSA family protein [Thalassotalea sp. LPB0316]|uniref:peroxiredoxin-like family protein n=1 Tax=Thalassotalea sp. LPB0316 TaxID=2769490 RepID=UPI00186953F4|nr:peroxiredoxin-like family protein [Thalassotalea sp. LPB0316]QOL26186.1 AhpC/TSA family protein [Thalassotalea sp. LPB0316]
MRVVTAVLSLCLSFSVLAKPIAESADEVSPLLNGQHIPKVDVVTIDNQQISLSQFLDNKKTILFFYRGGWCPFCNTQMGQLKQIEGQLKTMGYQLVGISTDTPEDLQKSIDKMTLPYQLLSDYNSQVSQAFGLAFFSSQKVTERYLAKLKLTNPLQKNSAGDERLVLPVPAVYLIDEKGLVQFSYVNPNFKVRLDETVLLAAAKAAM